MKRMYCEFDAFVIVEDNGKYGLEDKCGNILLPTTYDRIDSGSRIRDGMGFVLLQNGKKGYVEFGNREHLEEDECGVVLGNPNGCALAFLPCMYDWMEEKTNGLAMGYVQDREKKDVWYDYKSRRLYRQVRYQENLGDFDVLLDFSHGSCIPEIKKSGSDQWVRFPENCGIDILGEVRTDLYGVTFVLCAEWVTEIEQRQRDVSTEKEAFFLVEEYEEIVDEYREYFFLLLHSKGWIVSPAKRSLAELYAEIPGITVGGLQKMKQREEKYEK